MSVTRNFCRGCDQERMLHDGLCCDCRDYTDNNKPQPAILYFGVVGFMLITIYVLGSVFLG